MKRNLILSPAFKEFDMTTINNSLTAEELKKLRQVDFSKKPGFETAESMLAREVGEKGSQERDDFNAKALAWYYGEVLRDRRKALGITQKELAERVGRDRSYISRLEKGETDLQLSSFIRISAALGITLRLDMSLI